MYPDANRTCLHVLHTRTHTHTQLHEAVAGAQLDALLMTPVHRLPYVCVGVLCVVLCVCVRHGCYVIGGGGDVHGCCVVFYRQYLSYFGAILKGMADLNVLPLLTT